LNKVTTILQKRIQKYPASTIDVVIELTPFDLKGFQHLSLTRGEMTSRVKDAFRRELKPVQEAILRVGGLILASAWTNQTLQASIPARNIQKLANLEEVSVIDLPHRFQAE